MVLDSEQGVEFAESVRADGGVRPTRENIKNEQSTANSKTEIEERGRDQGVDCSWTMMMKGQGGDGTTDGERVQGELVDCLECWK